MIRRGMCCLCLSLLLGMLYALSREWEFLALFLLLLAAIAAVVSRMQEHAAIAAGARVFLCICLFCCGAVRMQGQQSVRDRLEEIFSDGDAITVQGQVVKKEDISMQGEALGKGKYSVEGESPEEREAAQSQVQQFIYYLADTHVSSEGNSYPAYGILVYSSDSRYQPGNIVTATGRYASFQVSRNEGNFNEKQYQQSRKWGFKVYADEETLVSGRVDKYALFLGKLRERMKQVFLSSMDAQDAGLLADIALGEKALLDEEIKGLYQDAGISHILAISGLHVSLVGMGLLALLQKMGVPRKWAAALCAGAVFSFGIFSGMEVSAVRAITMFSVLMAAQVLGYTYDSLTALSASAMIQLWGNPFLLEYAGFLFSYGAVLGVAVVWKVVRQAGAEREKEAERDKSRGRKRLGMLRKAAANVAGTLGVSACIQLVMLPLSAYFYYEVPPYGIFANACVLPFMGVLLALAMIGGILGSLVPILGAAVLTPAGWLLDFNELVCRICGGLPGASFITGKPPLELIIVYYAVLIFCLCLIWRREKRRYLAVAVLALFCLLSVRQISRFEVDVLDVGQGDGIFLQNGNGAHFFMDGGSSNVKNVGQYRILPFLKSRGIRSLTGWIVSHADADHTSGLLELLQLGYPVEYVIVAEYMAHDEAMENLLREAERAGCEILSVLPGMEFGSGDMVFTVLAPGENSGTDGVWESGQGKSADRNASSLSLLLWYQGFCGVFTGDIGEAQERKILESGCLGEYGVEAVDFYKAAHHGSDNSNSQEFLERLSPKLAVVSCAKKNSYGHPGQEAVARLGSVGSRIFFTMDQGQVRVRPEAGDLRVWTYLP